MKQLILPGMVLSLLFVSACRRVEVQDFAGTTPEIDFLKYFEGRTRGYGQLYLGGTLSRQFVVDIAGTWSDGRLVMAELFHFDDGQIVSREWKVGNVVGNRYVATAEDVSGNATGETSGRAIRWRYSMNLEKFSGSSRWVSYDDWMFQQTERLMLNRATISKWGISIGEMIILFEKLSE